MRNKAMQRFDVLVGSWRATLKHAWFLPEGTEVSGVATGSWHRRCLRRVPVADLRRRRRDAGRDGAGHRPERRAGTYATLYHDERGVCRIFPTTFDGTTWEMVRKDPDMHQRLVASVDSGRIVGHADTSENRGGSWRKDFDFVFERTPGFLGAAPQDQLDRVGE